MLDNINQREAKKGTKDFEITLFTVLDLFLICFRYPRPQLGQAGVRHKARRLLAVALNAVVIRY